jgi:hypothetical protein
MNCVRGRRHAARASFCGRLRCGILLDDKQVGRDAKSFVKTT